MANDSLEVQSIESNNSVVVLPISEAETIWNELSEGSIMPMFSYDWYKTWISVYNGEWEQYILLINNTTIAPFVRKGDYIQFIQMFTDFNDLIGPKNIWPQIIEYVKQDGVASIKFENIPETSETVTFFSQMDPSTVNTLTVSPEKTSPYLVLPNTFAEYLTSIREKRKKYNKFERDYPLATIHISENPEQDVEILLSLMRKNAIKQASFTPEKEAFFRGIVRVCKQHIRFLDLTLDGNIVAMQIMFIYKKLVMVYISGYDREACPNAGTYLLMSAIKQAIEEGYEEFSFLRGSEQYKYELGAKDFMLYSVSLVF